VWFGIQAAIYIILLSVLLQQSYRLKNNKLLLLVSFIPAAVLLTTFSLLNFSFCFIASIIVTPICIIVTTFPIGTSIVKLLLILLSPPVIYAIIAYASELSILELAYTSWSSFSSYYSLAYPFFWLLYVPLHSLLLSL